MKNIPTMTITLALVLWLETTQAQVLEASANNKGTSEYLGNYIVEAANREVKIQFSVKHSLIEPIPVYLAYSLEGLWLTGERSAPFRDFAHNPDLFYRQRHFDFGYEHLSNGQNSRSRGYDGKQIPSVSLQRLYLRPKWELPGGLLLSAKLSAPVYYRTDSEAHDYLGYADLSLSYEGIWGTAGVAYRQGTKGSRILVQASGDWSRLLRRYFKSLRSNTYLMFQAFHGHGESLQYYSHKTTSYRVGIRFYLT